MGMWYRLHIEFLYNILNFFDMFSIESHLSQRLFDYKNDNGTKSSVRYREKRKRRTIVRPSAYSIVKCYYL